MSYFEKLSHSVVFSGCGPLYATNCAYFYCGVFDARPTKCVTTWYIHRIIGGSVEVMIANTAQCHS
jgi:hypothetical protein